MTTPGKTMTSDSCVHLPPSSELVLKLTCMMYEQRDKEDRESGAKLEPRLVLHAPLLSAPFIHVGIGELERHDRDADVLLPAGRAVVLVRPTLRSGLPAAYNQLEVLQVLFQHSARMEARPPLDAHLGHDVGSSIHLAAESGHVQVLKFLVMTAALAADEWTCGVQEVTTLLSAARRGRRPSQSSSISANCSDGDGYQKAAFAELQTLDISMSTIAFLCLAGWRS
jgi:hypothetical protein